MHFKLPYVHKVWQVVKCHEQFIIGYGAIWNKLLLLIILYGWLNLTWGCLYHNGDQCMFVVVLSVNTGGTSTNDVWVQSVVNAQNIIFICNSGIVVGILFSLESSVLHGSSWLECAECRLCDLIYSVCLFCDFVCATKFMLHESSGCRMHLVFWHMPTRGAVQWAINSTPLRGNLCVPLSTVPFSVCLHRTLLSYWAMEANF